MRYSVVLIKSGNEKDILFNTDNYFSANEYFNYYRLNPTDISINILEEVTELLSVNLAERFNQKGKF